MMNLSSLYKNKIATITLFLIAFGHGVEIVYKNGFVPLDSFLLLLTIVAFAASMFYFFKTSKFLNNISEVCGEIKNGNFESRIINKKEGRELGKLADNVNNAIDVCDAFVRESQLAMKAASEGKYYRKIRSEGLLGMFAHSVKGINSAIDFLKDKDEADRKNKKMIDLTIESIANIINKASEGNLNERIDSSKFEGGYKKLIEDMNKLMEVILDPIKEITSVLNVLSEGDLTRKITKEYKGSFDEIKSALNTTITKLTETVVNIQESSESVNNSASEISAASADLSKRTEDQASTLEETAASMEEITAAVRQNTGNANEANKFAASAREIAERGGDMIREVVKAMSGINDSSKKIADIINVIDEIAFQTNLLALNAAVEAARAGDAGKGFAVVADEVRALAGRSASASKEIKGLIQESVGRVKEGSELVDKSGETLGKVVESFKEVAEKVSSIAHASKEQQTGIDEINNAVAQMDQTTQQNAAMVEQATASAQSLVELSTKLDGLISFFKIKNTSGQTIMNASNADDHIQKKAA